MLARIEGAPAGTKGISLFVVPKLMVKDDGSLGGAQRRVSCGSIEEKMGIHGNSTCVMNYDGATGWLVGEENRGLPRHVHDDERGEAWCWRARAWRNRKSPIRMQRSTPRSACKAARSPARNITDKPADPIIVHPDVRRTLMTIRAFNEAARALVLWTALKGDVAHRSRGSRRNARVPTITWACSPR